MKTVDYYFHYVNERVRTKVPLFQEQEKNSPHTVHSLCCTLSISFAIFRAKFFKGSDNGSYCIGLQMVLVLLGQKQKHAAITPTRFSG